MHKIVALWRAPRDAEGFERDYAANHVPLARQLPHVRSIALSKVVDGPYYRMFEASYESLADLKESVRSQANKAFVADAERLKEAYGASLEVVVLEVEDEG